MDNDKKLYTLLIYTENMVGMLSQVTAVFTRRQVNIESINASASSIEGVHKYTITTWSDEEQVKTITKQIEKKVDVIKADYYTDDQIFIREDALFKLSTPVVMENPEISKIIRRADAQIIEVNPTFYSHAERRDKRHHRPLHQSAGKKLRAAVYSKRKNSHNEESSGRSERLDINAREQHEKPIKIEENGNIRKNRKI